MTNNNTSETPTPIEETPEPAAESTESFGDLLSQFEKSHTHKAEGAKQLEGTVVSVSADSVYRTIVAFMTCMGPVTLFFFALFFNGSRRWAFAMAVAYSLLSPSYGLFPAVEKDRGIVQLPWRVQVLAKYGEGPHNTGLTLLPLALSSLKIR